MEEFEYQWAKVPGFTTSVKEKDVISRLTLRHNGVIVLYTLYVCLDSEQNIITGDYYHKVLDGE